MNPSDLAALLAAGGGNNANFFLGGYGGSPSLNGISSDGLIASNAARDNSFLSTLLLQRQLEGQQKALLAQQIAALNGLPAVAPSDLSMLIQQQQLRAALAMQSQSNRFLGLNSGLGAGLGGFGNLGSLNGMVSSGSAPIDASTLAKLLGGGAAAAPATTAAQAMELQAATATLPLPSDRRRKGRTGTFPQKLHQMLSDLERQEGGADIASFLPHGRAFAIHKPRDFVKHVMPKYFRMSRFSSFQRQLNLYDFQRITEGQDKGAYFHDLFVQGRPILSTMMKRNKIKGVKNLQQQQQEEGGKADKKEGPADEESDDEEDGDE